MSTARVACPSRERASPADAIRLAFSRFGKPCLNAFARAARHAHRSSTPPILTFACGTLPIPVVPHEAEIGPPLPRDGFSWGFYITTDRDARHTRCFACVLRQYRWLSCARCLHACINDERMSSPHRSMPDANLTPMVPPSALIPMFQVAESSGPLPALVSTRISWSVVPLASSTVHCCTAAGGIPILGIRISGPSISSDFYFDNFELDFRLADTHIRDIRNSTE